MGQARPLSGTTENMRFITSIFTLATAVTGAVTAELLRSCDQIVLNVRADNPPAINAYRRLGYIEHARFEERLIHRLGSPWPDITAPLRRLFARKEPDPR